MRTVVSAKGNHKFPEILFKTVSKFKNHFDKHDIVLESVVSQALRITRGKHGES